MGRLQKAFTLIELLVTIVILGVISSLAITSFNKTMQIGRQKVLVMNLKAIRAANEMYHIRTGFYWNYPIMRNVTVAEMNQGLGLTLADDGTTYYYLTGPLGWYIDATSPRGGWIIHIDHRSIKELAFSNNSISDYAFNEVGIFLKRMDRFFHTDAYAAMGQYALNPCCLSSSPACPTLPACVEE